jgi:NADH:ubiquinone oxidoreductase subunit K
MLLALGIFAIILSFIFDDQFGSIFTLFLLPIAGAESALALALLVVFYNKRKNINIT